MKITHYTVVKHSTCTVYIFLIYNISDDGSAAKDVPSLLSAYGEEPFMSGTGTFHPTKQADSTCIKSNMVGNEDVNTRPLNPPNTYDKLLPRKVSNEDLDSQPLHPSHIYDTLLPRKVSNKDLDSQPLDPPHIYDTLSKQKVRL